MSAPQARRLFRTVVLLLFSTGFQASAVAPTFEAAVTEDDGLPRPAFSIETFQTDEGLPQNSVNAVLQSRDGYLWMGTYNGLVRFDGVQFKVFDKSSRPQLNDGRVTSLHEDHDGTLWLGHENGGITRYQRGEFESVDLGGKWPGAAVIAIAQDGTGDIWALNALGFLIRITAAEVVALPPPARDTPGGEPSLTVDAGGRLWMAYHGQAYRVSRDGLTPMELAEAGDAPYVESVQGSRDAGLWVMTATTLRRWKDGKVWADLGGCPWGDAAVTCSLETRGGRLLVGTLDRGLFIVDPVENALHLDHDNGLPHDWVRSLCEDHEGNLWVGTSGAGLCVLRKAKVAMAAPPDGWLGRKVLSVTPGADGDLWAGTEGAGLYQLSRGAWNHYGDGAGLPNPFIWSVLVDRHGTVYAGTWGEGLFVQQDAGFRPAAGWEDLDIPVTALLEATDGTLWVGTLRGLLRHSPTNLTWVYQSQDSSFPHVRTLLEDRAGTIWFGTSDHGLGRLKDGVVKMLTRADGLASNYILDLSADDDGTLWIGTLDNGLCRLRNGNMATINTDGGLANNVIGAVADDGMGHLWLSSQKGILRVNKDELNRYAEGALDTVSCLVYGQRQGLTTLACSAGFSPSWCRTTDGRFVFPTARGLALVDPQQVELNRHPPSVLIEDTIVEGRLSEPRAESIQSGRKSDAEPASTWEQERWLEMAPGERRLEIHFTALSFVAPEAVRFRHRLEPLEKEWVDTGTRRFVNYSFVPPGLYTFQVIACNNDGVWNQTGAQLRVRVLPQFWETWLFRGTLAALVTVGLAGGVILDGRRRLRRRLERLESERAVERERTRIAQDIHDDLGASLTRILMLTQEGSLESESKEAVEESIRQVHNTARELTREMDEIVWAVNPEHDTLESLVNYLCRYGQTFLNAAHLRCRLDVPVDLPGWPVRAEVRHNLFLAFKEILNNIVRHAGASEVRLGVSLSPTEFRLALRDDGKGLTAPPQADPESEREDLDRIATGLGLESIQRRLTRVGGRFDVTGLQGEGTTCELRVPLKAMSVQPLPKRR